MVACQPKQPTHARQRVKSQDSRTKSLKITQEAIIIFAYIFHFF